MPVWVAATLGAVSVFGFAPFLLYPVPVLALAGMLALWQAAATARKAALLGFAFGCGFFLAGVSWVYVSMHDFGGMHAGLAVVATVLFCAYLALFPACAGFLYRRYMSGVYWRDALLAAAAWTITEWLRGWLLSGFPWLALGYAQAPPSPLAGYAAIAGVYGLSFLSVVAAVLLNRAAKARARHGEGGVADAVRSLGVLAALLLLGWGTMHVPWTQPRGQELSVSLLQGNIEQSLKWRPDLLDQSLDTYLRLARAHPARLVVLPETAVPTTLDHVPPGYLSALRAAAAPEGGDVLLGIVTRDRPGRYYNSAVGLGDHARQRYSKSHLVPFGEFTPRLFAWTLELLHIPMSSFSRGESAQPPLALAGERVAVNICYEDIFGAEIARNLPAASLLVNLSNTAWFGDSLAQPQHLQIARMRALETGRYMLRATNTGMTAVIDPKGNVVAQLEPFTTGALVTMVRGHEGQTPYGRWGDALALAVGVASIVPAVLRRAAIRRI